MVSRSSNIGVWFHGRSSEVSFGGEAVVRSRESAVTLGLEYSIGKPFRSIQFGRCRESGRFSEARCWEVSL